MDFFGVFSSYHGTSVGAGWFTQGCMDQGGPSSSPRVSN
jgi:hypothetical protein